MKKYVKKIVKYIVILVVASIIASIVGRLLGNFVENLFVILVILAIFYDIGKTIENKDVQKRYFIYMGIVACVFVFVFLISFIETIPFTEIRLYPITGLIGAVGAIIMLLTLLVMFFDIRRILKK